MLHSQLGRGMSIGNQALCAGSPGRYWWVAQTYSVSNSRLAPYSYVQRLTAGADTLPGGPVLGPVPPGHEAAAVLAIGRKLIVTGREYTAGANFQISRYTLTAVDTVTRQVLWRHAYERPGFANDYAVSVAPTPRGGYVISGDGQVFNSFRQHLFLETDSLGRQLKQRMIYPLGPNYTGSYAGRIDSDLITNIIALPNAGGYLTTGVADSVLANGIHNQVTYLMRLDTALHVTWVYRHPTAYQGNGNRNQRGSKVRLLPNGTAAFLVRDVRGVGTRDLYLVNVDPATGRHLGTYVMSSNTQSAVIPFDWQWVGDGTLVVCGKGIQAGITVTQGWLARFDLRNTPLGTRSAASADAAQLEAWPNPARGQVRLRWPAGWGGRAVALHDVLGRQVAGQTLVAGQAEAVLPLAGVGPGVYVLRLHGAHGVVSKRLVVE